MTIWVRFKPLAVVLTAIQLSACSWGPGVLPDRNGGVAESPARGGAHPANTAHGATVGDEIARIAQELVGVPYLYGGQTPRGFDCSGLVYYTHGRTGVNVPRTAASQFAASQRVQVEELRPGDLLFFRTRRKPSHVGIYIGEGNFVHAPSTGKLVSVGSLRSEYYNEHLIRAGRLHSD